MATEICIKTRTGTYCSSSPIKDCGCGRPPEYEDPFQHIPDDPTAVRPDIARLQEEDSAELRNSLRDLVNAIITTAPPQNLGRKSRDIVRTLKLLMLKDVETGQFVITGL
jgi:hypothetical protein